MNINDNKIRYLSLIKTIPRCNVECLCDYLENKCDFFVAPASTKYHGSFEGGLCAHSLEVYDMLVKLVFDSGLEYDDGTLKIVALLHDISKINTYEKTAFNKKVYSDTGSKTDEVGKFDWVSEPGYKVLDESSRFIYSNHEATAEFIASQFVNLTLEESAAILHHHFSMGWDSIKDSGMISTVSRKYPLITLLHCADMLCATFKC